MLFGDLQEMCVKKSSKCIAQMIDWFLTSHKLLQI